MKPKKEKKTVEMLEAKDIIAIAVNLGLKFFLGGLALGIGITYMLMAR